MESYSIDFSKYEVRINQPHTGWIFQKMKSVKLLKMPEPKLLLMSIL